MVTGDPCRVPRRAAGVQGANQREHVVVARVEEASAVESRVDRMTVVGIDLVKNRPAVILERLEVAGGAGNPSAEVDCPGNPLCRDVYEDAVREHVVVVVTIGQRVRRNQGEASGMFSM